MGALSLFRRYALEAHGLGVDKLMFEHLDFDFMTGFADWLRLPSCGRQGASAATCNLRASAIRAYVKFSMGKDAGLASIWITLKAMPPIKKETKTKEALSEAALSAMLDQPNQSTKLGLRNVTLMVLMYDSACRVSEIINLKKSDIRIDGAHSHIIVTGKGRKERRIPLMDRTVEYLRQYISVFHTAHSQATPYLFYTVIKGVASPLSQDCVSKTLKKSANEARVRCAEIPMKIHAHLLRRTRATHLYQSGHDIFTIARFLGHEQIETTKEYMSPSMDQLREALENTMLKNEKGTIPAPEGYEEKRARLCGIR
jgi:site-specific recombinase XerD